MKEDHNNVIDVKNLQKFNVMIVIWFIVDNVICKYIMEKDLLNIYVIIFRNKENRIRRLFKNLKRKNNGVLNISKCIKLFVNVVVFYVKDVLKLINKVVRNLVKRKQWRNIRSNFFHKFCLRLKRLPNIKNNYNRIKKII
jgi:hypothetical protein